MANRSSNDIWTATQDCENFERRAYRFREEMRPLFYQYLGITPQSRVLDGGCGTGVFTRYLAKDLVGGHATGFEINEGFVQYGQQKLLAEGLADRMTIEQADGFELPYPDGTFDAVTNYTYIGVLSDPEAGLRELIRVCKPGGTVSCAVATHGASMAWQGEYPFEDADELQRLAAREREVYTKHVSETSFYRQSHEWSERRYPKLLDVCGLSDIHIYPFGHVMCYSDTQYDAAYRKSLAISETKGDLQWFQSRFERNRDAYAAQGYSAQDAERLFELLRRKLSYLEEHFEDDRSYEWFGAFNFIVSGKK